MRPRSLRHRPRFSSVLAAVFVATGCVATSPPLELLSPRHDRAAIYFYSRDSLSGYPSYFVRANGQNLGSFQRRGSSCTYVRVEVSPGQHLFEVRADPDTATQPRFADVGGWVEVPVDVAPGSITFVRVKWYRQQLGPTHIPAIRYRIPRSSEARSELRSCQPAD